GKLRIMLDQVSRKQPAQNQQHAGPKHEPLQYRTVKISVEHRAAGMDDFRGHFCLSVLTRDEEARPLSVKSYCYWHSCSGSGQAGGRESVAVKQWRQGSLLPRSM
ncbi:MAG: hypothetical protein KDJ29_01805, partial [Hyphomicrobiales bacterium]|nr:hypothetical protein [Hyphomicrobiales bacterium]